MGLKVRRRVGRKGEQVNQSQQVENIARAFHESEEDEFSWGQESEILKEEFRKYARLAMAILAEQTGGILPDRGDLETVKAPHGRTEPPHISRVGDVVLAIRL